MNTKNLTGLMLIISPIVVMSVYVVWSIIAPNQSPGELRANSDILTPLLLIVGLALLMWSIGLKWLADTMTDGNGGDYARMGGLLIIIATTGILVEISYMIGTAGAPAEVSDMLYIQGQTVGVIATIVQFLGLSILGIGIYMQKNLNKYIPCLMVLAGVIGIVLALMDYSSPLMGIAYIGFAISSVLLGIFYRKAKD